MKREEAEYLTEEVQRQKNLDADLKDLHFDRAGLLSILIKTGASSSKPEFKFGFSKTDFRELQRQYQRGFITPRRLWFTGNLPNFKLDETTLHGELDPTIPTIRTITFHSKYSIEESLSLLRADPNILTMSYRVHKSGFPYGVAFRAEYPTRAPRLTRTERAFLVLPGLSLEEIKYVRDVERETHREFQREAKGQSLVVDVNVHAPTLLEHSTAE